MCVLFVSASCSYIYTHTQHLNNYSYGSFQTCLALQMLPTQQSQEAHNASAINPGTLEPFDLGRPPHSEAVKNQGWNTQQQQQQQQRQYQIDPHNMMLQPDTATAIWGIVPQPSS